MQIFPNYKLTDFINKIQNYCQQYSYNKIPDTFYRQGLSNINIVFGSVIHGTEIGSLAAFLKIMEDLSLGGKLYNNYRNVNIYLIFGNLKACKLGLRFIERDLNRSFDNYNQYIEDFRAQELKLILTRANLFIDFHQTKMPSKKYFYSFEYQELSYLWAKYLSATNTFVTRKTGQAFSTDGLCADEFVRLQQKAAITLEMGQCGITQETNNTCYDTMIKALNFYNTYLPQNINDEKTLLNQEQKKELDFYTTTYIHKFTNPYFHLIKGFNNFNILKKQQIIGYDENNQQILSPHDGYILFPQYPIRNNNLKALPPYPSELFRIINKTQKYEVY